MAQERLNKYLAGAGIASRRKADEIIAAGLVRVNGQVVKELGTQIDPAKDEVKYHGRVVKPVEPLLFMFNKPVGVTSTVSDPHAEKTIADYFGGMGRVYPIGRLDQYSEGLILVTSDGELANQLTHPKFEHEKEYKVVIDGNDDSNIQKFSQSFTLEGYKLKPMQVEMIKKISPNRWLISLILKEGRKRQIRRVAEILGYKIVQLKRVRIGKLKLGDLPPGQYCPVKARDII